MTSAPKTVLNELVRTNLHIETGFLNELADWCRNAGLPPEATAKIQTFREELRYALGRPGTVTPEMYEGWTDDDRYPTQTAVQARLQEIWDACFG